MAKTPDEAFHGMTKEEVITIKWMVAWRRQARLKQLPPDMREQWSNWTSWGSCTGRGTGKSLSYANWIGQEAARTPKSLCHVVAPTHDDVRSTRLGGPPS